MSEITIVGLDLAKNVFQVHGADASGHTLLRKKLRRSQVLEFFRELPPCVVAMEACGGSHFWGREIGKSGYEVRLIPPAYVKPFVKRQKNDAADAEAICKAAVRPTMRYVSVKSEETQGAAMVFRVRELLIRQRTQTINALRGHLNEFGQIVPQGTSNTSKLIAFIESPESELPIEAIATLKTLAATLTHFETEIARLDAQIASRAKKDKLAQRLMTIPGTAGLFNMNCLLVMFGWCWLITVRRTKYLNNIIEQDHRFIKKVTRPMQTFKSFSSASATLAGIEVAHMIRKGQFDAPEKSGFAQFAALAA